MWRRVRSFGVCLIRGPRVVPVVACVRLGLCFDGDLREFGREREQLPILFSHPPHGIAELRESGLGGGPPVGLDGRCVPPGQLLLVAVFVAALDGGLRAGGPLRRMPVLAGACREHRGGGRHRHDPLVAGGPHRQEDVFGPGWNPARSPFAGLGCGFRAGFPGAE